jgi:hypothetical protein
MTQLRDYPESLAAIGKVERQVKVLIKILAILFLCPSKHSKFSCWNIFPKYRRNKDISS